MITRKDIAALSHVTNAQTELSHRLSLARIDIRWVGTGSTQPLPKKTLLNIDFDGAVHHKESCINSPRSALIVLRNGLSVSGIIAADEAVLRRQASLEGLTPEALQVRLEAESERRRHRLHVLQVEYEDFNSTVSSDELLEVVRAFQRQTLEQERVESYQQFRAGTPTLDASSRLTRKSFSPVSSQSKYFMDDSCVDVADKNRERVLVDIRRSLRQKELKMQQAAARENNLWQHEVEAIEHRRQMRDDARAKRREHDAAAKDRSESFRERVVSIRRTEQKRVHAKAAKMKDRESFVTTRLAEIRELRQVSHAEKRAQRQEHISAVRNKDESQQHERREALLLAAEDAQRKHDETVERRRSETIRKNRQRSDLAHARRLAVVEASQFQREETEARQTDVALEVEQRHKAFAERREHRLEARRLQGEERAKRSMFSRAVADQRFNERLKEMQEQQSQKLHAVELAREQQLKEKLANKEALSQLRASKREEQQRVDKASEFSYIGYASDNMAKTSWIRQEETRRAVLRYHLQTEREAVMRAAATTMGAMDLENLDRMKGESQALNAVL